LHLVGDFLKINFSKFAYYQSVKISLAALEVSSNGTILIWFPKGCKRALLLAFSLINLFRKSGNAGRIFSVCQFKIFKSLV
jgi:hypothetical protein